MPSSRLAIVSLLLSCCLAANVDAAELPLSPVPERGEKGSAPDLEAARRHFSEGVQFYNAGDYKLSLIEFRRSHEISNNYRILYNIGQVNQQLGNYTNALIALEEYLLEGGSDIVEDRNVEVSASVALLRTRVAHIHIASNVQAPEV